MMTTDRIMSASNPIRKNKYRFDTFLKLI